MILVGCSESQKEALSNEICRQDPSGSKLVDLNKEKVSQKKRHEHYREGSVCFVTALILIIDSLEHEINPGAFAGILFFDPTEVFRHSGIEFSLRLFHRGNPQVFVHLISNNPASFEAGFTKVLFSSVKHLF